MPEDLSSTRVRSVGRKWKLILVTIVVVMGAALSLRVLDIIFPTIVSALTNAIVLSFWNTAFLSLVVIVVLSLVLVAERRRLTDCRPWGLFLPRRRTNVMIPSVSGDKSCLMVKCGNRRNGESFVISMLRLLSVPRDGVRQRVRGAVARDEQEEGAAVSDEKQYQFSHLESLSSSGGHRGCMAYELQFKRGLVNVGFTVSADNSEECKSKRAKVEANVQTKFPVQFAESNGDLLKEAALMSLPWGAFQVEAIGDKVAQISGNGFSNYVAVVALRGRPEMAAHEQRCQIDQLITGVNSAVKYCYQDGKKKELDVSLVVPFEQSKPPKYPSDASLRERLREKPDVRLSLERKKVEVDAMEVEFGHRTGWWKVSPYAVVLGHDRDQVEGKADSVANVVKSVWSGSHFSPNCMFLHGKEIVRYFPIVLRRWLLPKRYITEMSSVRLSSLVHIPEEPHPPLSKVTPPPFEAPDPIAFSGNGEAEDGVTLGDVLSPVGGVLYPLVLPINAFGTHMVVFGESGFGKSCLVIVLLMGLVGGDQAQDSRWFFGGRVSFLVLDQKGEYRCLISQPEYGIAYFLPASQLAPLNINLFDPQGDEPESHAKRMFSIIREILFANRTELTPQMERVLYDILRTNIRGDWATFNEKLAEYLKIHGEDLPQLGSTIQGILNRVGLFTRPPLSYVFDCKKSNIDFRYIVERSAIIDLSEIRRQGTPEDVRLVANIIGKYVSVASLNRGADFSGKLKHLFVVDDALDVVPEVLMKKTTADVGTIEYMAILLRATGQGLVVVSQRPNIAENVTGNSAVKVFFRTVVDSRELASWVNLSDEQAAYLKVLPKREAVVTVPQHSAPMRIRIPDVGKIVQRKVTNHDIIVNNMINYPLMYDMQTQRGGEEPRRVEMSGETGSGERENEEDEVTGKENCKRGGEEEQWQKQEQPEMIAGENRVSKLTTSDREAWSKLHDYLMRGLALDSDFVSKMLGVSQQAAHRSMLALRSAGLVSVAKIPNYAYGKGIQYLYYSGRSFLGGGVVGYVRERLRDDLEGREAVVELSPKDVPNADMVLQHDYPLVIHVTSIGDRRAKKGGLRLPALSERIQRVAETLTIRDGLHSGSSSVNDSKTVVVTLWRRAAEELNEARRQGKLKGCLCVIPFAKKSVEMLADYVLNHIALQTLLGEGENEEEEAERKEASEGICEEEPRRGSEGGVKQQPGEEKERDANKQEEGRGESEGRKVLDEQLRGRVLVVIRELVGVEPHVVAERLGVSLPEISEVVRELKKKQLVNVARNLPYINSLKKANAVYYLDARRSTALHDTLMNIVWQKNNELGGTCRDYSFECSGKSWHTDGVLENTGGKFLLEVVAGRYHDEIMEQLAAYSSQVRQDRYLKGVIVVAVNSECLLKLRERALSNGLPVGVKLFITALRSVHEKQQFESLLKHGAGNAYHKNPTH